MPPKKRKEGAGPTKEEISARQLEEEKRKRDAEFEIEKRSGKGEKEDGWEESLSVGSGDPNLNPEELTGIVGVKSYVRSVHEDTGIEVGEDERTVSRSGSAETEWNLRDGVKGIGVGEIASIDSNFEKGEEPFMASEDLNSNNDFSHDESRVYSSDREYETDEGDGYEADGEVGFGKRRRGHLERLHRDSREIYGGSESSRSSSSGSDSGTESGSETSHSSSSDESGVNLGREELGEGLNVYDDRIPEVEQPRQEQPNAVVVPGAVARLCQYISELFVRR